MELNYRTFLRHLVLAGTLIASLYFIEGFQGFSVRELIIRNRIFLGLWFIACPLLGWIGHRLTSAGSLRRWVAAGFAPLTGSTPFRLYRAHRQALKAELRKRGAKQGPLVGGIRFKVASLFLRWASCSRCVAWWLGGGFSFAAHVIYWPTWPAAIYFAALGASLSAATAVFFYLRRYASSMDPR